MQVYFQWTATSTKPWTCLFRSLSIWHMHNVIYMSQSTGSGVKYVLMWPFHRQAVSKFFPSVWCQWPLFGPVLHDLCWQVKCKAWKDIHLPWRAQEQQHKERGMAPRRIKHALISIPVSESKISFTATRFIFVPEIKLYLMDALSLPMWTWKVSQNGSCLALFRICFPETRLCLSETNFSV